MANNFYNPLQNLATTPDVVIQQDGKYIYQCWCDRSKADFSKSIEELENLFIWRIVKTEITIDENGAEVYRTLYPYGRDAYEYSVFDRDKFTYEYKK